MQSISIEEAQVQLPNLIGKMRPGEELVITRSEEPVARLTSSDYSTPQPRQPGSAVGKLRVVTEDDKHLEDFREYMP